jgi:hypothetical protein
MSGLLQDDICHSSSIELDYGFRNLKMNWSVFP